MKASWRTSQAGPDIRSATGYPGRTSACGVTLGVAGSLVAVYVLLALGRNSLALAASALCASMAVVWAMLFSAPVRVLATNYQPGPASAVPWGTSDRDGSGRYLDIDAVEVEAVYVLGSEVFTHLTGGVGSIVDPLSGDERHIETSDVSSTWRCQVGGRRQSWLAGSTSGKPEELHLSPDGRPRPLRLLIEDDDHWVALPELAAQRLARLLGGPHPCCVLMAGST